jgi:hypothetical protein
MDSHIIPNLVLVKGVLVRSSLPLPVPITILYVIVWCASLHGDLNQGDDHDAELLPAIITPDHFTSSGATGDESKSLRSLQFLFTPAGSESLTGRGIDAAENAVRPAIPRDAGESRRAVVDPDLTEVWHCGEIENWLL